MIANANNLSIVDDFNLKGRNLYTCLTDEVKADPEQQNASMVNPICPSTLSKKCHRKETLLHRIESEPRAMPAENATFC